MNSSSWILHSNQSFGPAKEDHDDFDFSLVFEESVLSILPSVLLLVIAPFRLLVLSERRKRIGGRLFRSLKLLAIAIYGALQVALLVLWSTSPESTTRSSVISATLAFANVILFCMLSYMEHSRSLRPSPLLSIYLIFSILFDAVRLRTLWLVGYNPSIRGLFTASLAMKVLILAMEAKGKRRYFSDTDRDLGPEESSGVFSQSFFLWLNALIQQGFKKVLSPTDLYPIDEKMASEALAASFWERWQASPKTGKNSLLIALFKHFKWQLLVPVFPRLVLIAATFCQPLLINRFLSFLQYPDQSKNIGYGLIGAYGLVYLTIAISTGFYWHRTYHGITLVRGSLVSTIYRKTTELSIMTSNSSAAVSLMSTDIERIVYGHRNIHEVWANVLSICIATWLLQNELGLVCLAPVLLAAVCFCGVLSLSGPSQKRQGKWMKKLEKRVGMTATMLSSIKGIKLSGLTSRQFSLVQRLRLDEIDSAAAFRMIIVATATISFTPLQISPLITFGTFAGVQSSEHKPLDASRMFTSLTLLILLNSPLSQLFQAIPNLFAAVNCIRRIQDYLNADSRDDYRLVKLSFPSLVTARDSSDKSPLLAHNMTDDIELTHMTNPAGTSNTEGTEVISVRQGAFGWSMDAEPVVRDINISLERSTLTMVIGPIASGKSTLVKALLGEVSILSGSVQLETLDIAYCDQHAWLINASLQRNILGFAKFDGPWYRSVIRACALDKDIATLPNGDRDLIGSGGITLSGGQKQRVAVARAVYARKSILIFDDVFAGFDNETTRWVSDHLFGPCGLLRAHGTTVILVTHAVDLLPSADHIIALGNDGRVTEQGTFEELNAAEGYVHSFSIEASREKGSADVRTQDNDKDERPMLQRQTSIVTQVPEDGSRQTGDISTYSFYFKAIGWRYTVTFALLLLIESFFKTFGLIWLKWWSDFPEQVGKYLGFYAGLQIMTLILLANVVWHSLNKMVVKSGKYLHSVLLSTVLNAPMSFFSATDTGATTNRFSQDIELIDGQLPNALLNTGSILLSCIGYGGLTAAASLWIALSFPGVILVFYAVQKYYLRTSRQLRFMDLEAKSPLYTQFIESLGGLATIRAFGWENDSQIHNNELLDASQQPFYLLFMIQRWLTLVLDLVAMGLALIVVGLAFKTRATVSAGFTGVSLTNVISLAENAKWLVLNWTELETSIGAVSRIKSFEATTTSEHLLSEIDMPPQLWPRNGLVEFREVSAAYNGDSDNNALSDLSLTIKPGEKVGLCGRSGSGKSSLILALFRMIELNYGSIHIDGIDISTLQRNEIRSRLNAIPQDPYFFAGTVRLNLDPWETQSDEVIRNALAKVELLHIIEDSCGGLNADMDVNLLSQGQRQLFCLARATLRPGKIVVLDEVTSSVDRKTDDLMQQIIRTEFADRTIIAIAHRLETIVDFDKIAVLDKGALIEYGSPAELLSKQSHFRNLYEMYKTKTADEDDVEH